MHRGIILLLFILFSLILIIATRSDDNEMTEWQRKRRSSRDRELQYLNGAVETAKYQLWLEKRKRSLENELAKLSGAGAFIRNAHNKRQQQTRRRRLSLEKELFELNGISESIRARHNWRKLKTSWGNNVDSKVKRLNKIYEETSGMYGPLHVVETTGTSRVPYTRKGAIRDDMEPTILSMTNAGESWGRWQDRPALPP